MNTESRWKLLDIECPEEDRVARLLVEWGSEEGRYFINSAHCDHPRLKETDNWDCNWSCLEQIIREEQF